MSETSGHDARYHDGRSATGRAVRLRFDRDAVALLEPGDGGPIAAWPYAELRATEERFVGDPLRLSCRSQPEARLVVEDPAAIAALVARAPRLAPGTGGRRRRLARWGAAAAGGFALIALVLLVVLPRTAEFAAAAIPLSWERELGRRLVEPVVALVGRGEDERPTFCSAPAGRAALDRLAERLTAGSPYRIDVMVLDVDRINALALPGGPVILFRGLIDFAGSPDELAGVLAHEAGHVLERHGTERLLHGLGLGLLFGFVFGDLGGGVLAGAGEVLLAGAYSREAEAEADRVALELLARAGIGAQGLAAFFARLHERYGAIGSASALLSSHPGLAGRLARARAAARAQAAPLPPALDGRDWAAVRALCG